MALELAPDEAVGRADIVQDLDDRPVGGHGAAGRERDRQDGRHQHQAEHGEPADEGAAGHVAHAVDPAAMIVEARGGNLARQRLAHGGEIRRGAGKELHHDQARYRQIVQRQAGAEPGLDQLRGSPAW